MENSVQNQEIVQGTTVKYNGGYYRVSRVTKNTVNLAAIFSTHIYHKGVAKSEVVEAHEEWYAYWSKSETYMCM